ncbi:beta-N-acetylhexosaminidase [Radiobacillus sp. PE A8.2]|uniref:beta-N-acetylhexosaminidase n=1 Tax=Radiobacillus sp. PE A8.2 TaxID=3380349 RepID=UPI00388DB3DE
MVNDNRINRRHKPKGKKRVLVIFSVIVLSVVTVLGIYAINNKDEMNLFGNNHVASHHEIVKKDNPFANGNSQTGENIIDHIVSLSKKGKIDNSPFIAGKTMESEVTKAWGNPEHKTELDDTVYEDFPERKTTIGITNDVIVDLRSFTSDLKKVHYQEITETLGDADETNYYHDDVNDQIILQYAVNSDYQLKWILPKPTDESQNPVVDHISIVSIQEDGNDDDEQSQSNIIANMSLSEKIGQMVIAGVEGTSLQPNDEKLIKEYYVGGIIFYANNLVTHEQTRALIQDYKNQNSANPLPLFVSVDQEGGRITRIPGVEATPTNQQIGEKGDPDYAYNIGQKLGQQVKSVGFNVDFAPVLDINSNPNNPVIGDRSYGANASLVSKLGIQTMLGIQSQNIISVVKHFPGHGDTSVDSHVELPKVTKTLQELNKMELVPFKAAIDHGADVVMVAHILNPNLDEVYPASMSKNVITNILRQQLGFQGVVMTDDLTMGAIMNNFGIGEAAVQSIKAGSDVAIVAHDYNNVVEVIEHIKKAVQNNEITEERINESVKRIIELKNTYLTSGAN